MEKDYGKAVDIWSTGVIFGEFLSTIEANCPKTENRSCLFPGKSCFPLSPNKRIQLNHEGIPVSCKNDQLEHIFNLMGTPTDDEMSFITDKKAINYLK